MRSSSLGLLALSLIACGVSQEAVQSSEAAHTEGELIWSNDPYAWQEITQSEIDPALGERTAPPSHPVTVRLQAWVDRFDGVVRKLVRERTGQVLVAPKPNVRLVADPTVNAYVMGLPVCVAKAPAPAPGTYPLLVFLAPQDLTVSPDGFCVEPIGWPAAPAPIDWLNRVGGLPIRQNNDAIVVGYDDQNGLRAAGIASIASISLVNVNAGLVAELSEKSAAVVLAHELGHYYRSHSATASAHRYDFWYDRDRHLPERPEPVANQAAYRFQYEQLKLPRFLVPGQNHHPRLGSTLVAWAKDIKTWPGHACEPVQKLVASWPAGLKAELSMETASRDLSGAARRAYLELEVNAAHCIDTLRLTDAAATTDKWATNEVSRQWFVDRIASPLRQSLGDTDLSAPTLKGLVEALTTRAKAVDAEGPAFLQRLEQNQIGLYTSEQEADDISMELALRVGLDVKDVFASYTDLMRYVEKVSQPEAFEEANNSLSSAECEALLANGFKQGGRDVHVPLGTLEDPHHALCYRLYNLYRESEAHRYIPGPLDIPNATQPWSELQKQALDLLDPTEPSTPPQPGKSGADEPPSAEEPSPAEPPVGDEDPATGGEPAASPTPETTTSSSTGCSAAPGVASSSTVAPFVVGLAGLFALRMRRKKPAKE